MLKTHEIQERRAKLIDAGKAIEARAKSDKRETLTADETADLDRLASEIETLNGEERRARIFEAAERQSVGETVTGPDLGRHELRNYSVAKAVQEAGTGRLSGLEAEVHQELSRGREVRGVMIPTEVLLGERRDQTVGSDPAGGYLVATTMAPLADRYRPALKVEAMGATVLRGLVGDLEIPALTGSGSTSWVGEKGAPTRSGVSFGKSKISPRTVAGEYQVSRRLMLQSSQSIEEIMRRDLGFLLAQALDAAAINGEGASNQPLGLLGAGITEVTPSTAFSDTTADLIAALELDDVTGSRAFLTNPTVLAACRKMKDEQGHILPLIELFHGERVEQTTQVPKTLGASSDKSAVIFGTWSELVIGYWSAVDILVNPYHPDVASAGGALIHAFLDADVAVRHAEAFSFAEI